MKSKKIKDVKSILLAVIYFFRQATGYLALLFRNVSRATFGGNLDPTYICGLVYIKDIVKQKKWRKEFLVFLLPILLIVVTQLLSLAPTSISKYLITLVKLVICILTMLFVKNKFKKLNLYHFSLAYTVIAGIFTLVSLFFQNTVTWRYNDYVNSFDLTRLQLFYLEPSELGFHISIIIIILICLLFSSNYKKYRYAILSMLFINLAILYLSKALGAIVILSLSICVFAFYLVSSRPTKNSFFKLFLFILIGGASIALLFWGGSSITERVNSVLSGTDGSVNYRLNVSFEVLGESLRDYNLLGTGLGNVNTDGFISRYSGLGLDQMLVNSFVYFWVETGIIGIVIWAVFMIYLFRKCLQKKDKLSFVLLVFVFLYQFVGGHYTSGLTWMIYGYILSDWRWNEES